MQTGTQLKLWLSLSIGATDCYEFLKSESDKDEKLINWK